MQISICRTCKTPFEITEAEQQLLQRLVPVIAGKEFPFPQSKDCPRCRMLHRNMFMNERNLYYRTCDKTGKTIVSNYAPESKHIVYYADYWLGDEWEAMDYAQELNFDEPFFVQYKRLFERVPRMSIDQASMENSDFNNHVDHLRNCYMCVQAGGLEDCTYCNCAEKSRDCHDCLLLADSEMCYGCVNCSGCYEVFFSVNVRDSRQSMFLQNCHGMKDSLFCVNMQHKQYCIWNKQHTKEEYEQERAKLLERLQTEAQKVQEEFDAFAKALPQPPNLNHNAENCRGDYLKNCKDCIEVYCASDSENVWYAFFPVKNRDCLDVFGMDLEHSYFTFAGGNSYNCHFCFAAWDNCKDVHYSDYCFFDCEALFGCVGLKRKKYCILNKQYTKEEYEMLVPKLIEHMKANGEWGEYFPKEMSPFAYNESVSFTHQPLTQEQVEARGLRWRTMAEQGKYEGPEITPESIEEYKDPTKAQELLAQVLTCQKTGQPYRLIAQELAFLLRHGLPVPRVAPRQRYLDMLARMNPQHQQERQCQNPVKEETGRPCENRFFTSHPESSGAIVYCQDCYRKEMV